MMDNRDNLDYYDRIVYVKAGQYSLVGGGKPITADEAKRKAIIDALEDENVKGVFRGDRSAERVKVLYKNGKVLMMNW